MSIAVRVSIRLYTPKRLDLMEVLTIIIIMSGKGCVRMSEKDCTPQGTFQEPWRAIQFDDFLLSRGPRRRLPRYLCQCGDGRRDGATSPASLTPGDAVRVCDQGRPAPAFPCPRNIYD